MAENDNLYQLNGASYRGSRYSNFVGGGLDAQGNVSSAAVENQSNNQSNTPSAQTPQVSADVREVSNRGVELGEYSKTQTAAPQSMGGTVTNLAIGAAVPAAATTIGGQVGANIAANAPAFGNLGTAIGNRVSAGLLGSSASSQATNAALSGMGGKFGPATSSAVNGATSGASVGGAIGGGIGTAAATLLTGGSVKDAAFSGIGTAIGTYFGGPIGGFVGSTIGSFVGKAFGGKTPRATLSSNLTPDATGSKLTVSKAQGKGTKPADNVKYGNAVSDVINAFGQAIGLKFTNGLYTESNVGKVDRKTTLGKGSVSSKPYDVDAVALNYLRNNKNYTRGDDADLNSFWDTSLASAKSVKDLGASVDSFFNNRNGASAPNAAVLQQQVRRQGDRFATFYS